ncbi:hypothetical protein pb186bvf_010589 [Paramecium bursaria]
MNNIHLKNKFCIRELLFDEESVKNNLLICPICQMVLIQPKECQTCQNLFCNECLGSWLSKSTTCPFKCPYPNFQQPHRFIKNALSNILLKCPNHQKGCKHKCTQENIELHYEKCQYVDQQIDDLNMDQIGFCNICQSYYNLQIVHTCVNKQKIINELEQSQMQLIESHQQMVQNYEQQLIQKEEEIKALKDDLIFQKYSCHNNHKLTWVEDQKGECKLCYKSNPLFHFRCKQCRFDYCSSCKPTYVLDNRCPKGHKFKYEANVQINFQEQPDQDQQCDQCYKYPSLKGQGTWRDERCNFELCVDCFNILKQ